MRDTERGEVVVVGWLRGEARRRRERTDDKHMGKPANKHEASDPSPGDRRRAAVMGAQTR
jgi:hypothetical protein